MVDLFGRIANSPRFQNFITLMILLAGAAVGMETYQNSPTVDQILSTTQDVVLGIFILEIIVKVGAKGRQPWLYFKDNWNIFDFIIVAACFLPVGAEYAMVLRLARLLRVLKLVRALPKLQMLVSALLKSIPSMAYVTLLLFLLFYVYGCSGVFLFGRNDPVHFVNLQTAMLSLFRVVTLEDWTDIMYIQIHGCDVYGFNQRQYLCTTPESAPVVAPMFFVSFILLGTMIVLNLFVGVIMSAIQEAQTDALREERMANHDGESVQQELMRIEERVREVQTSLSEVMWSVEKKLSVRPPEAVRKKAKAGPRRIRPI